MSDTVPLQFAPTLPAEEQARANFYGLLARLLYRPPDGGLLEALASAGEIEAEDETLAAAWRALCDAMRHFIAADARPLEEQRRFFRRWIYPVVEPLCAAIEKSEHTAFYKTVARFAKAFFSLEHSAFEML